MLDEAPGPWMHAYTYSAHPVGCAVALRTLQIIEEENLVAEAARKGAYLLDALRARLGDHPHVGEIRGKGLMCAVEFVKDRDTKAAVRARGAGRRAHSRRGQMRGGCSAASAATSSCWRPPFVTPDTLLDRIAEILGAATEAVLARSRY